jgi:hypothetical protein
MAPDTAKKEGKMKERVRRAGGIIHSASAELLRLRKERIGNRSVAELREELGRLNRAVATGSRHLLRQKKEFFEHDTLAREIGLLKTIVVSAQELLSYPAVQEELSGKKFSVEKITAGLHKGINRVQRLRHALANHERLFSHLARGIAVKAVDLERLEHLLLSINDWEEHLEKEHKTIAKTTELQGNHLPHKVAASLVLPVASASAKILDHTDYWA